MISSPSKAAIGALMEERAEEYLRAQGFEIIEIRYKVSGGELDRIALHEGTLVFIEVRYRQTSRFQSAAASVNLQKQKRLFHAARVFLHKNPAFRSYPCRFDVLILEGNQDSPKLSWYRDAFRG